MQDKPKVLIPFARPSEDESAFETHLKDIAEVRFVPFSAKDEFYEELKTAEALVIWGGIDEEMLRQAPKLKIVARLGVGYDAIDVKACTRHGVYAVITPGVVSNAVAELMIGLMLSLSRKIPEGDRYVRTKWAKPGRPYLQSGIDLAGKTLGIVGLGRIGREVAAKAKSFRMDLAYYDKVRDRKAEDELGIRFISFEELLKTSDFVTLHVPLMPETRALIGEKELRLMKKTAYLINTSRGMVVDEKALCKALGESWIAGAGLDVYEKEPLPLDSPLIKSDKTVLMPHAATATIETRNEMIMSVINSIREALFGKAPANVVPEQKGKVFKK